MNTNRRQKVLHESNIYPVGTDVTRQLRNQRFGHLSGVIWMTGLSGSGKSTIAKRAETALFKHNYFVNLLDGDNIRSGLNSDLDFSHSSRVENLRRTSEVCSLFANTGSIVLAPFISPFDESREFARNVIGENFHLVYIHAELDDCIGRDPKGLYKRALAGEIKDFTGIGQRNEIPDSTDQILNTSLFDIDACVEALVTYIIRNFSIT